MIFHYKFEKWMIIKCLKSTGITPTVSANL